RAADARPARRRPRAWQEGGLLSPLARSVRLNHAPSRCRMRPMKPRTAPIVMLAAGLLALLGACWRSDAQSAQPAQPAAAATTTSLPRTPTQRGPLSADEQATIDLFERSRMSVVFIATTQRVVDVWTRNALQVPRGT